MSELNLETSEETVDAEASFDLSIKTVQADDTLYKGLGLSCNGCNDCR